MDAPSSTQEAQVRQTKTSGSTRVLAVSLVICALLLFRVIWVQLREDQTKQKEIATLSGNWFCRTTLTGKTEFSIFDRTRATVEVHEIGISLNSQGLGKLTWKKDGNELDVAEGKWSLKEDMIVIDRADGGWAAFRIASRADNRLTLVQRGGTIFEFTRVN